MLTNRATEMLAEEPFEMSQRDLGKSCQLLARSRIFDGLLHLTDYAEQRGVRDPESLPQRHPLGTCPFANMGLQKPVANSHCQCAAVFASNKGMHHVQWCGTAARRQSIAIDFIERAPQIEFRVVFKEGRRMLPVDGAAVTVEELRPGENVRAARYAAYFDATTRELLQPGKGRGVSERGWIAAGADKDIVEVRVCPDTKFGLNSYPIGGLSRLSID